MSSSYDSWSISGFNFKCSNLKLESVYYVKNQGFVNKRIIFLLTDASNFAGFAVVTVLTGQSVSKFEPVPKFLPWSWPVKQELPKLSDFVQEIFQIWLSFNAKVNERQINKKKLQNFLVLYG